MNKLSQLFDGAWVPFSHPPIFDVEETSSGESRIVAGVPSGDVQIIRSLVELLTPPFFILYVLHTSRGEGAAGRYQSPEMDLDGIRSFLQTYGAFLSSDGRFDLWIRSAPDQATLVWDRHNLLFGYGPQEKFGTALSALGFANGRPSVPSPHGHEYRKEFDGDAKRLLAATDWAFSPLKPEDTQF